MLKRIKQIQKIGIYRNFSWTDTSCFKRYNAMYGFNGSGKSTLARVFQSLDGTKIDYRENGSTIIFEEVNGALLETKDDHKHLQVLSYDEEFIATNFSWNQGIKSFVVIGKKSKEQEEELIGLRDKKTLTVNQKKITEAEIKNLTEMIGEIASSSAAELKKQLVQYNSTKYISYNKKPFEADVKKYRSGEFNELDRSKIADLKSKVEQIKLDDLNSPVQILSELDINAIEKAFSFIGREFPTRSATEYSEAEISWLDLGLSLHEGKESCLFCEGNISKERKKVIEKDITSEVAAFIKSGNDLKDGLRKISLTDPKILRKNVYPDFHSRFDSVYDESKMLIDDLKSLVNSLISDVEKKVSFLDGASKSNEVLYREKKQVVAKLKSDWDLLVQDHNQNSTDLQTQKNQALRHIEAIFYHDFLQKTAATEEKLATAKAKNQEEEKELKGINDQITNIENSLQSEAKAAIGINNMLSVFLGRSDLKLEYKEEHRRFEIVRKNSPAKKLSEGEKTAITVCYFLILVNANPEVKDLIVVVDDPISSLDSNNLYNAYAVLKENLKDVKQLFILTHNLYFFRLVYKWFKDFDEHSSYFRVETSIKDGEVNSDIRMLKKQAKETSTEYILLYSHLKNFVKRSEEQRFTDSDFLPYPNMLRRLIEAYLYTRHPGKKNNEFEEDLIALGVEKDIARKADRFCNDFSHARFDSLFGQEGNSISQAPEIVKGLLSELERIDRNHFDSMKDFI